MTHPASCRFGQLRAAALANLGDPATLDALVRLALHKAAK